MTSVMNPATGRGAHFRTPEPLEATIRRVVQDTAAVGADLTPRTLALAIAAQGWTHKRAPVTTGADPVYSRREATTEGKPQ